MQALLLAAGMGRRLGPLTRDKTKCLITLHGRTLLERSMDALADVAVDRFVLVIGFGGDAVRGLIGPSYRGIPVAYVTNPDYAVTNNIWSLHKARELFAEDDTLLLESDLVYDPSVLSRVIGSTEPNLAVVARYQPWMDGTMVTLDDDGHIASFIPKRHLVDSGFSSYYKTVNIYKFSKHFIQNSYLPFLEAYVKAAGRNEYYEQVLGVISGLDHQQLAALPLTTEHWYEIDDLQDYDIAETLFAPTDTRYSAYLGRHGGYWRFPSLTDFCYLVNPYFPPPDMVEEMQRSFTSLLTEYPSSAPILDGLAAKMFDCPRGTVSVGNGAAEWISALGFSFEGKRVVVPVPTFEEYLKRFPNSDVVPLYPARTDLRLDVPALVEAWQHADALVLVNPDNPSGQCLTDDEVTALLEYSRIEGKWLILDESFVDFADPEYCGSFIRPDILAAYPKLVVLKSISKSYGVPGARLGVIASGNKEFLSAVAARRSVWNINSFGEYFLQIIGKYLTSYHLACEKLRADREQFSHELQSISGLRVLPSHANYILCELPEGVAAHSICEKMLMRHNLLIKDSSSKIGLEDRQFVRIAVRSRMENEEFAKMFDAVLRAEWGV